MTTVNILRGFTTYENGKRVRYEKGGKPDVDEAVAADWSAKASPAAHRSRPRNRTANLLPAIRYSAGGFVGLLPAPQSITRPSRRTRP